MPDLKITRICYQRECDKRGGKETQILTIHKIFMKTHIFQQTEHQLLHNINRHVNG